MGAKSSQKNKNYFNVPNLASQKEYMGGQNNTSPIVDKNGLNGKQFADIRVKMGNKRSPGKYNPFDQESELPSDIDDD